MATQLAARIGLRRSKRPSHPPVIGANRGAETNRSAPCRTPRRTLGQPGTPHAL